MKEYGLIVNKVDEKGGTIACYGPVYATDMNVLNEIIKALCLAKDDKYRYVPDIYVLGGNK